jgi:uncharacterized membrane protein
LLAGGWLTVLRPALPVFRPAAEVAAFQFLQEHARPGDVVLSAYESGNPLPAWAPVRVVIGHGPESADLSRLRPLVTAFFDAQTPDTTRLDLLRKENVDYVFYGPSERSLGDWDPTQAGFLQPVYRNPLYQVFQVLPTPRG